MAYLDDFCDNTLIFLQQNIVYVIVNKERMGLTEVVVEARAPAAVVDNITVGAANGVVKGGVYKLRSKKDSDARGLPVYFCGYEQNSTKSIMLGNDALWMFTVTMDGCTFGVGSQVNTNGSCRVAHANNARMAEPSISLTPVLGGATATGAEAQRRTQAMLATSHVGPGGLLIEPDSYLGADRQNKATTFGYHAGGGAWTFKALAYSGGGASFQHHGVVNYP